MARRDVELTVDLPSSPVPVTGDREMLERVVINLTDNAVKFTPDGGHVSVALTSAPGQAVLEVADTGIGVPANEQQRLFDRFFRSSLAQQHAIPGSGLGPLDRAQDRRGARRHARGALRGRQGLDVPGAAACLTGFEQGVLAQLLSPSRAVPRR